MQANKKQVMRHLNIAKGQIEGIIKMVENDEYCIDISNQLMASDAILKKVNREVLQAHIEHCIKHAIATGDNQKIDEILDVLERQNK